MKTSYANRKNQNEVPDNRFGNKTNGIKSVFRRIYPFLIVISGFLIVSSCSNPRRMILKTPNNGRSVAVAVNPANNAKMIVASETGGLFKSDNSGEKWAKIPTANNFTFTDVLYCPTNPDIVIASGGRDFKIPTKAGIWRSENGGKNWTFIALANNCSRNFSANALHFQSSTNRLFVGTSCGIAVSDDLGLTWNYLPATPGYSGTEEIMDIETSSQTRILFSTPSKIVSSSDNGATWSDIGSFWASRSNRAIAVSPADEQHVYFATNNGLSFTTNNGGNWTVISPNGIARPSFVEVSARTINNSGSITKYKVYHSNGGCGLKISEVTHSANPNFGNWVDATTQHCDYSDIGFASDGKTPLLLTGDGGNQVTSDGGLTWTLSNVNYEAMQITEVTGQLHNTGNGAADLYFGTQDNDIWASSNTGNSWDDRICCEGFFLEIPRDYLAPDQTRLTGVACAACYNFISGPLFSGRTAFPNPPNSKGNPIFVGPSKYLMNTSVPGSDINLFQYSADNGATWSNKFGFSEPVKNFSKVVGPAANPEVFTAIKGSGSTPSGNEVLLINRVTDVLGSGTPIVSTIDGFGSLGTFPTMFAWYKPFGVLPSNRSQLIVPDIISHTAKRTTDAGATWTEIPQLTDLVTAGGTIAFDKDGFTQITSFGYDPECACHILVGTREAGVMESFDYGATWKKIKGSESIPLVSSFFFTGNKKVIISSYGSGLWRYSHKACPNLIILLPELIYIEPTIVWKGARIPISQINNPDACPVCAFAILKGGKITNVLASEKSDIIKEVTISGGQFVSYSYKDGQLEESNEVPFKVRVDSKAQFTNPEFAEELKIDNNVSAQGIYLEGDLLKGVIFSDAEITPQKLPKVRAAQPSLSLQNTEYGYFLLDQQSISIRATNFDVTKELNLSLNGIPLKKSEYSVKNEGESLLISLISKNLNIGAYTLLVKQGSEQTAVKDVITFNISNSEQFDR